MMNFEKKISDFKKYLVEQEKAGNTIEKYVRDIKEFYKKYGISSGFVFITRNGMPLSRTYIWTMLKSLCKMANVDVKNVFDKSCWTDYNIEGF